MYKILWWSVGILVVAIGLRAGILLTDAIFPSESSRDIEALEAAGARIIVHKGCAVALEVFDGQRLTLDHSQLDQIASLKTLEAITLPGVGLTDESLRQLMSLRDVRFLNLSGNHLTADGCAWFVRFKKLRDLDIANNPIGAKGVAEIVKCTGLKELDLLGVGLDDNDLKILNNAKTLQWLRVGEVLHEGITDAGLAQLDIPSLRTLLIIGTAARGANLARASFSTSLDTLIANNSFFDDDGAKNIREYSALKWLDVRATKVTDAGIPDICNISTLQYLDLHGTPITDKSISHLAKLPKLKIIDIFETNIDMDNFRAACPKVTVSYLGQPQIYATEWKEESQ